MKMSWQRFWLASIVVILASATHLTARAEEGNVCKSPEFSVRWVDHSAVELVTKADPPGDFEVEVRELPGTPHNPVKTHKPKCPVHATAARW